jgi:hypothetical protein
MQLSQEPIPGGSRATRNLCGSAASSQQHWTEPTGNRFEEVTRKSARTPRTASQWSSRPWGKQSRRPMHCRCCLWGRGAMISFCLPTTHQLTARIHTRTAQRCSAISLVRGCWRILPAQVARFPNKVSNPIYLSSAKCASPSRICSRLPPASRSAIGQDV